jgi:hypothetical protein
LVDIRHRDTAATNTTSFGATTSSRSSRSAPVDTQSSSSPIGPSVSPSSKYEDLVVCPQLSRLPPEISSSLTRDQAKSYGYLLRFLLSAGPGSSCFVFP